MPASEAYSSITVNKKTAGEGVSHAEALLYTLLYTLLTGNQMSELAAWVTLIIEDVQLMSLLMDARFGFKELPHYVMWILNPFLIWQIDTAGPSFYTALAVSCVLITAMTLLAIYVGRAFANGNFSHVGPLVALRVLVKLCTTILVIPFLEVLMYTFKCHHGTMYMADTQECWSAPHAAMAGIGGVFLVCLLLGSMVLISLYYDHEPPQGRHETHSQPHARYNLFYYLVKFVIIAVSIFSKSASMVAAVILGATLLAFVVLVRIQPYYCEKVTQVRAGLLLMTSVTAFVSQVAILVGTDDYAGLSIMLALLFPSYYAGCTISRRVLRTIEERTIDRLQSRWRLLETLEAVRQERKASPQVSSSRIAKSGVLETSSLDAAQVVQPPSISRKERELLGGEGIVQILSQVKEPEIRAFGLVYDVEIAARFITVNESENALKLLSLIFKEGIHQFEESSFVHLWEAYYNQAYNKNLDNTARFLKGAERKEPPFDIRFSIFHVRRSLQEEIHAQALGMSQTGSVKILEVIQFETKLDRAKRAHHGALLTLKEYYQRLKNDQLDVNTLSSLAMLLSQYDTEARENYISLIDRFTSRAGTVMRLYASYLRSIANDNEGCDYFVNLADNMSNSEEPEKHGEESLHEPDNFDGSPQSSQEISEGIPEVEEEDNDGDQSIKPLRDEPNIGRARFRSLESFVPSRRGSLVPPSLDLAHRNSLTTPAPTIPLPVAPPSTGSSSGARAARIGKAYRMKVTQHVTKRIIAGYSTITFMFAVRVALFVIMYAVTETQVSGLLRQTIDIGTILTHRNNMASLFLQLRQLEIAGIAGDPDLFDLYKGLVSQVSTLQTKEDLTSFDFEDDRTFVESQDPGTTLTVVSYGPSKILSQTIVHTQGVLNIPLADWSGAQYASNKDWRFFMDNYQSIFQAGKVLGDTYSAGFWAELVKGVAILACLLLSLVLALVGQIFLIFEPLLATANHASATMLKMMRALPQGDVTSMLTSVTGDFEDFVETSGLSDDPSIDNSASPLIENGSQHGKERQKQRRMYLLAVSIVFAFVVAISAVGITALYTQEQLGWLTLRLGEMEYYVFTAQDYQVEVIRADRNTWLPKQAEAQLLGLSSHMSIIADELELGSARAPSVTFREDLATILAHPTCLARCTQRWQEIGMSIPSEISLRTLISFIYNQFAISISKGFNGVVVPSRPPEYTIARAYTLLLSDTMAVYHDVLKGYVIARATQAKLWVTIILVLVLLSCFVAHFAINRKVVKGLTHELMETVALFWTAPLDSMLSVPTIERFLETGTVTMSSAEEERLAKAKVKIQKKRTDT